MIGLYFKSLNQFGDGLICEIIGLKMMFGEMNKLPNKPILMKTGFIPFNEWVML
jgi:hypothetical protein